MRSIPISPIISPIISPFPLHQNPKKPLISHNPFNLVYPKMSINLQSHAFAGNPMKLKTPKPETPFSPSSALESLNSQLLGNTHLGSSLTFKVLPFRKSRPLASSSGRSDDDAVSSWNLGWVGLDDFKASVADLGVELSGDLFVYLGCLDGDENVVYWGIDVSSVDGLVSVFGNLQLCFVEVRTLMVAADWLDARAMGDLAIAGHVRFQPVLVSYDSRSSLKTWALKARALLEWHNVSKFCGHCGEKTVPREAGRRKQCSNPSCKKRIYPRVDPVVIMLVIDKENDRALLSKQSRFVPRMWSCLAGFIEAGESLEEAVRRETWEETGIEVGEVFYHSSQPWPVGPNNMPCQLMVGFFAYAKSFDINVDKEELEDAQWFSREDVRNALTFAEYKKAQRTSAAKVEQMCKGVERQQSLSSDFNIESGELAPMFVPGPFAIAHHLISSWVYNEGSELNKLRSSMSNL